MKVFILAVIVSAVMEIRIMLKKRQKKEAIVFASLAVIALALGILHFTAPFEHSIATYVLNLMGMKE